MREQVKQHSGSDDELARRGKPHMLAFVRSLERIPVGHFFAVAKNILTINAQIGKSQQKLLEMLSQSRDTTLRTEAVMQNTLVIKFQVTLQVVPAEPLVASWMAFTFSSLGIRVLPH
jgi:hypothetical protein